ncbi:MAG TPA: hypothetical protein VFB30_21380, partial [Spirochaetia bacterium]|nr:hypothetical protein [Spirochaetia bacterium]
GNICYAPVRHELTGMKLRKESIYRIPDELMKQVKKWAIEPGHEIPQRDIGKPYVLRTTLQLGNYGERREAMFLARDLSDFLRELDGLKTGDPDATPQDLSWLEDPDVMKSVGLQK